MTGSGGARRWGLALGGLGLAIVAAGMLGLGWLWHRDRTRAWEPPRWDASRFVAIGGAPRPEAAAAERWLVAVNLECPYCLRSLRQAVSERSRAPAPFALGALVVDTAARPRAEALPELAAVGWWWDSEDVWRRRWGHRVYGEILVFDSTGLYLRTLPPMHGAPEEAGLHLGVPPDDP